MSLAATSRRASAAAPRRAAPPKAGLARCAASQAAALLIMRERRLVAGLRRRPPGEQAVAAEHHALQIRVGRRHLAELEAEIEAGTLPGQKADLVAVDLLRQLFGVLAGRDRDHRVGMDVIDMACGTKPCSGVSIEVARGLRLKVQWLNSATISSSCARPR